MAAYLEICLPGGIERFPLPDGKTTVGRGDTTVLLAHDPKVGRLHAVLVPYEGGWTVRDVGSRNGTYLNGERILAERCLRPGDEILLGETRIWFHSEPDSTADSTETTRELPVLTRRECEVLIELCRPLADRGAFSAPARVTEIAERLVVGQSAVKTHLSHLYVKFGGPVDESGRRLRGERARVWLANEALTRGAVSIGRLPEPL